MVIKICPHCNRRYIVENATVDFIHNCNSGNDVVDNEDVLKVGDWTDYTGSGEVTNVLLQGATNKLWGTRAGLEGGDEQELTKRGVSSETHRTRKHLEFIKTKGGNIK